MAKSLGSKTIAIEATPSYLVYPLVPHRVRALLPQVMLVVLLRNPVDRAISHYHLSVGKGVEELAIEDAFDAESERLRGEHERLLSVPLYDSADYRYYSYLQRGRYAEQLEPWFSVFPREQFLILDTADLFADPDRTVRRVCDFAGLAHRPLPSYGVRAARDYIEASPLRERLRDYYAPHNERLWELLGERFDWE
jgi:hypothetical protein